MSQRILTAEENRARIAAAWRAAETMHGAALPKKAPTINARRAERYRFDPIAYVQDTFGWEPWRGTRYGPGQAEVFDAYALALRQQHEAQAFENGEVSEDNLACWQPGMVIKNIIRIESGHSIGKTRLASGLFSHFFDCFQSIIYAFAPSKDQIKLLLWKEIKKDREGRNELPGRLMPDATEVKDSGEHFAIGRATKDAGGHGLENVQGQHHSFLMFVLDEAEGIPDYVFDAVKAMTTGGIWIVLMLANPRTRTSRFHKIASQSDVANFRIPSWTHPNVIEGREVIPGAVTRRWIEGMVDNHCEIVNAHNADDHTFELPFDLILKNVRRPAGTVYQPNADFMFKVLGRAPENVSDRNLIPVGRYQAAVNREPEEDRPEYLRIGVDMARFGLDFGTIYLRWNGQVWCAARPSRSDTTIYYHAIKKAALGLKEQFPEITHCQIRIDAGGEFGKGAGDRLKIDDEMIKAFPKEYLILEIHFGGTPRNEADYYDVVTEATVDVAETLKSISILEPNEALEQDLCEREYEWRNRKGKEVKKLESKEDVRSRLNPPRSPDDGDGFVLAVMSDFLAVPASPVFSTAGQRPENGLLNKLLRR